MFVTFIQNAALLISLSFLFGIIRWYRFKNKVYDQLLLGAGFGLIAIAAMMMPHEYSSGMIYDGRSVVLTLAGLWGGGVTALVSVLIAGAYRIYLGGDGIWAGLATIVFCGATGLLFRQLFTKSLSNIRLIRFILVGFIAHLVMLASQLFLPTDQRFEVISKIWLPVLLIFPLTFALISKLFQVIGRYINNEQRIRHAEMLYRTTLLSIGDAVLCTDKDGKISQMNAVAEQLTGWSYGESEGKDLDEVFKIINEDSREKVESPYVKVMRSGSIIGLANHTLLLSKDGREIPVADSGAPIKNERGEVTGVVIVFRDQTEERNYQRKIAESEALYRELVESTYAISWEYDVAEDKWVYVAPQVTEILGWLPEEWTDLDFWKNNVHPDEREEATSYCFACAAKGESHTMEYRFKQKGGGYVWLRDVVSVEMKEGKPHTLRGVMFDITEKKTTEKELMESEERFRKAILRAPIPIMVHDEDGNVINLSEGWTKYSGYAIEDIPTLKEWTEKAYGEKAEEVENYVSGIFDEDETVLSGEFEIFTKTSEKRIWNFFTTPLGRSGTGKRIMLSMAPDLTQLKQVQKELGASESAYRSLFENHSAVKLLIEPESGQIIKANSAAAEFYGWSIEKLQSMNIDEINISPRGKIDEALKNARINRKIYFEFKHRLANGQIRDIEVFTSKVQYAGKELLHSIVHDVTEKKQLFNELIIAKEKAEESERLKTAFLANMSHEIRTPLNGILGFTNLLTREEDLAKERKNEYAAIISKSADGLLKIINDILDISRLETGKVSIEQKPFQLGNVLKTIYSIFKKKMADAGMNDVELIVSEPTEPIILNTDEDRLMQIFSNLIDNALRFTSRGSVTFGVSGVKGNKLELFVKDTGSGIPKEKHGEIFDRFSQLDAQNDRSYGGTGLGLSIVKKLLELMGGEITVESTPGKGSCFRFQLPVYTTASKKVAAKEIASPDHKFDLNGSKILVVEDDTVSRLYFDQILKEQSAELFFAETGEKALQLFDKHKPDLILMDIRLPDANGLDVVRQIRKKSKQVVIMAQTAYAMPDDMKTALDAGCNDYITKPIDMDLFFGKIERALQKRE